MLDHKELIEKYIQKRNTATELEEINRLLAEELEFKKEFSFHIELQQAMRREEARLLKRRFQELDVKNKRTNIFPMLWKIAAVLVIVIGLFWFFNPSVNYEKLYADHFEPYPNIAAPLVRGNEYREDRVAKAFQYYDQQEFKKAIPAFEELYHKDKIAYANFYYAISLMADHQEKKAISVLKDPDWQIPKKYRIQTNWYLALAYIKTQNKKEAASYLEKIIETNSSRSHQAQDLLSKIK